MHPTRRNPSQTLPRNFTFHYNEDGDHATLPQQIVSEAPRQIGPYRLRRRRELKHSTSDNGAQHNPDHPIPTIEISQSLDAIHTDKMSAISSARRRQSPPRTPIPQIISDSDDDAMATDNVEAGSHADSISRPSTACSGFSDSSASSSIESFPSLVGSIASPECDSRGARLTTTSLAMVDCNVPESAAVRAASKMLLSEPRRDSMKQPWTEEMDRHLWMTYIKYLQDPRHTPFKMLPGTAPPSGVCSRIAREAKHTWRRQRAGAASCAKQSSAHDSVLQADSPDTAALRRSGSLTPTNAHASVKQPVWPRSDSSTRRRLRSLCKSKPALASQYHRFLATRSPSPFSGPTTSRLVRKRGIDALDDVRNDSAHLASTSSFGTRDISLSLFGSTSLAVSTMNRFTAESAQEQSAAPQTFPLPLPPPPPPPSQSSCSRPYGHQKSRSLHSNVYPGHSMRPRDGLASPFQPFRRLTTASRKSLRDALQTPAAPIPRLASPLQFAAPKQRSRHAPREGLRPDHESGLGPISRHLYPEIDNQSNTLAGRRMRSRTVSMGDVSASSRRLSLLFEPPPIPHDDNLSQPTSHTAANSDYPGLGPGLFTLSSQRRLGSPFTEKPSRPVFNTFPRNFSLRGLEPALEAQEERQIGNELETGMPVDSSPPHAI